MSSKGKVSIAVVGCGGMANNVHYPSLKSFNDVEIVGICDLHPDRLHATGDAWGIPRDRRFGSTCIRTARMVPACSRPLPQSHRMTESTSGSRPAAT